MHISRSVAAALVGVPLVTASLAAQHPASHAGQPASASAIPPARFKVTDTLPFEHDVLRGKLANGLVYYIRRNVKPEQRAELRLVVRAGSLQEDDDQRGLAHMVEHMQFEGSPHFPNRSLVSYIESIGMVFGADLNAATTFDNTTYQLRVPTTDPVQLAKAFDVLQDWAGGATFDSTALAAQRGIVLEEWRRGQGVGARLQKQTFPVVFKNSRYALREPIGDPDIIKSATREKLVRFYKDWYRPNLMAVIAVGDFDPKQIEAMIKTRFAGLTNPAHPRPRLSYTIPDNTDPLVAVVTDTEVNGVAASVTYKLPILKTMTAGNYREALARNMMQSVLAQRYREVAQAPDPPFLGAGAGFGGLTEGQGLFSVSVSTTGGGLIRGLNASLSELERVAQFGALDSELDRIRTSIRTSMTAGYAERGDVTSGGYAEAYRSSFLSGEPVVDVVTNVGLLWQFLPTITNADIKRLATVWRTAGNRIIIAQLPKSLDIIVPDTSSLLASFEYPLHHKPTPYVELAHDDLLIPNPPAPGSIVKRASLPNDITEWTLSNGIRVLLRPSTNTADQVYVTAYSPGGFNLDLDKGLIPAQTAAQVMAVSGMGKFSLIDLEKRLTGHLVHFGVSLDGMSEGIQAAAITNDMETMFQLIYLGTTQPRIDSTAVAVLQRESRVSLENRNSSPLQQFQDTVTLTMAQHNPWVQLPSLAQIDSIDPVKSLDVFRDRFRDMSDFRFVIVGHFSLDSIAPLVERYLASLPGGGRVETPKDLGIRPPTGMVHKTVAAETEPKATTYMSFYGPLEMTPENEWNLYALVEILRFRLVDRLRQQLGGTYTPSVQLSTSEVPYPNYGITIGFITSPERDEELAKATIAVLDSLQRYPATDEEVVKVREAQRRFLEEARKQDGYWAQKIARFDFLHRPFTMIGTEDVSKNWTAADVQRAAKQFFHLDSYARFDLVPGAHANAAPGGSPSASADTPTNSGTH